MILIEKIADYIVQEQTHQFAPCTIHHAKRAVIDWFAPIKAAGLGENTIGIVFMHDAVAQAASGFPIVTVAPCEGTGYEIGSMSIIAGARHLDEAQKFYDWALSAEVQSRAKDVKSFQVPSNRSAEQSPMAPDLSTVKLINYDFITYGSSSERKRLLKKWDDEVSTLPQ